MSYYAIDQYDSASLSEQLLELLSDTTNSGAWFALVDTAFTHGSKVKWTRDESWPVYSEGRFEDLKRVSPHLLPLSTLSNEALGSELTRLLARCKGLPMLSFIRSEKSPKAICQSWQNILEVETSDGQRFLLRFADSRVTPVIAKLFPASAWARLSNGIDEWLSIDREGELLSLPVAEPQANRLLDQEFVEVSDKELSRILQSGEADALANILHENFPDMLPTDHGATAYRRLAVICDLAAQCGMESSSDLMILTVAVFLSDGRLLENPTFVKWLEGRPWITGNFADAIDQFVE